MVINHLEKLFVTSDAATIIRELEVVHPAAKLLVMASQQQEQEVSLIVSFCHLIYSVKRVYYVIPFYNRQMSLR